MWAGQELETNMLIIMVVKADIPAVKQTLWDLKTVSQTVNRAESTVP